MASLHFLWLATCWHASLWSTSQHKSRISFRIRLKKQKVIWNYIFHLPTPSVANKTRTHTLISLTDLAKPSDTYMPSPASSAISTITHSAISCKFTPNIFLGCLFVVDLLIVIEDFHKKLSKTTGRKNNSWFHFSVSTFFNNLISKHKKPLTGNISISECD